VLTSRFLRVLIEFFIVSCKALSWREEPSIGLWSIIFAMAANTSIFPFWYLAFKRNQEEPSIDLWSIIFAMTVNTSIFQFWYLAFKRNQVSS